jgi:hypothetical protein
LSRHRRILKGANIDEIARVVQRLLSASKAKGGRSESYGIERRIAREMRVRTASTISLYVAQELCISIIWASIVAMASKNAMHGIVNGCLVYRFFDH